MIQLSTEAKYLGLVLDKGLTWGAQLGKVMNRAYRAFWSCRGSFGKTWGLKPKIVHWVYTMVVRPGITYASTVWWPRVRHKTSRAKLSKLQGLAYLGITGAMKTAPTAAIEVLLGLPPLHLAIKAQAGTYRLSCNEQWKPKTIRYGHAGKIRDMMKETILQMGADKMIPMHTFNKPFTTWLPDRSEWGKGMLPLKKGEHIWYTDGSKTNEGTRVGVCGHGIKQSLSFSLGQYTTVFQAEVYAIKARADENIRRCYRERNIYVLSDSQAAIKALHKCRINSKLVWDCILVTLVDHNKVQLIWVPGHEGIEGNESADQLAKRGSLHPFIGPEPPCGISEKVAKWSIRDWTCREHQKHW
jgi:ribonuclease HI